MMAYGLDQSSEHDTRKRCLSCIVYIDTYTIPKI